MIEIDTKNILFIAGGAFVGLDGIVKNRVQGTSIGFNAQVKADMNTDLHMTTPDDLVKFGMIPTCSRLMLNSLYSLSCRDLKNMERYMLVVFCQSCLYCFEIAGGWFNASHCSHV
jgi:ATP-dependent Clp protease ATP-binding subunit ClpX